MTWRVKNWLEIIQSFGLSRLRGVIGRQAEFERLTDPPGTRPLIIAIQPGDDVMAMAGAMAEYSRLEIIMTVLTLTAGLRGTMTGRLSRALGPRRRREQAAAHAVITTERIRVVNWSWDEPIMVDELKLLALTELVDELNPDIVYVPSPLDTQTADYRVNRILVGALGRLPSTRRRKMTVAQYELETPVIPNRVLSIDAVADVKQQAIARHESQSLRRNYQEAMLGLNRYRAAIFGWGNLAEAFFVISAEAYRAIHLTEDGAEG